MLAVVKGSEGTAVAKPDELHAVRAELRRLARRRLTASFSAVEQRRWDFLAERELVLLGMAEKTA